MTARSAFPRRGFVYVVSLAPAIGREMRKIRPAVIVSNDHMNELAATVLVMPITGGQFSYDHWIQVSPPEGGVHKPSSIVTEQIRAIDKRRLRKCLGRLRPATMAKIEDAVRDHFGLPEGGVL